MEEMKIIGVHIAEVLPPPSPCFQQPQGLLIPPLGLSGQTVDWNSLIISFGYQVKGQMYSPSEGVQ